MGAENVAAATADGFRLRQLTSKCGSIAFQVLVEAARSCVPHLCTLLSEKDWKVDSALLRNRGSSMQGLKGGVCEEQKVEKQKEEPLKWHRSC